MPAVERILHPMPLLLIERGRTLPRNLRAEPLAHGELMSELRVQGIDDISAVDRAYLGGNGQLSVIRSGESSHPERRRPTR